MHEPSDAGQGARRPVDPLVRAIRHLSNYKDCVIATSVRTAHGKPFEASFSVSRRVPGSDDEIVHTERVVRTFAYGGDARAAALGAAQAYVDNRDNLR